MPNPYADYQRDGFSTLLLLCKELCKLITTFEPVIRAKYGDNEAIMALLDLNIQMCSLLPEADAEFKEISNDNSLPPADAGDTVGINPSAPAAADPDLT